MSIYQTQDKAKLREAFDLLLYECPWCRVTFKTNERLEKHWEHCEKRFEAYCLWNEDYAKRHVGRRQKGKKESSP